MKNRNTLQRRLVLETVRRMHNHPTADEIFREIAAENTLISKATVYRNLKILSEQGEILHIPIPDGADCFDFNTKGVRCEHALSERPVQQDRRLRGFSGGIPSHCLFRIVSRLSKGGGTEGTAANHRRTT